MWLCANNSLLTFFQRDYGLAETSSFSSNSITANIHISFRWNATLQHRRSLYIKYNVEKSPADGHCFLHSVVRSSNAQHVNNVWLTLATLKRKFRRQVVDYSNKYMGFLIGSTKEMLMWGSNDYIDRKHYNTKFGDLVPMIVADALHMDILIVENHGSVEECKLIESESHYKKSTRTVIVYKRNDHYDSIVYKYSVSNVVSEVRSCADTQDQQLQDVDNVCSTLFQDGKCDRDELCTTNGNDFVLFRRDESNIDNSVTWWGTQFAWIWWLHDLRHVALYWNEYL